MLAQRPTQVWMCCLRHERLGSKTLHWDLVSLTQIQRVGAENNCQDMKFALTNRVEPFFGGLHQTGIGEKVSLP